MMNLDNNAAYAWLGFMQMLDRRDARPATRIEFMRASH